MSGRLPSAELERLADAVCRTDTDLGAEERRMTRAVYALLAAGEPVTAETLAAAAGTPPARAAAFLDRQPHVERDDTGAVTGFGGLSLRPTPHRLVVDGRVRYAWCAWDSLFLPVVLATPVDVFSRCPPTGRPVTLRVAPTGILHRDPRTLVVSFIHPRAVDRADLGATFCGLVHFFADPDAASRWAAQNAGRLVLDPDDAFALGQRLIGERCGPC